MNFETWKRIQDAISCIRSGKLDDLAPGRHDLFDGVYVNIAQYQTKTDGLFEAHRKYIDIHYVIHGAENMLAADLREMKIEQEYDEPSDSLLGTADGIPYLIKEGQFMVVLPEEAHLPGIALDCPQNVKKAVIKVLV